MEIRSNRSLRRSGLVLATLLVLVLLPAAASAQSDEEAARAVVVDLVAALTNGDADAAKALYTDDAVSMGPQEPANAGREAIDASLSEFVAQNTFASETTIVEVEVHGDLAHVRATYHDTVTAKESGEVSDVNGNWLLVLERGDDGAWKINRELWVHTP